MGTKFIKILLKLLWSTNPKFSLFFFLHLIENKNKQQFKNTTTMAVLFGKQFNNNNKEMDENYLNFPIVCFSNFKA